MFNTDISGDMANNHVWCIPTECSDYVFLLPDLLIQYVYTAGLKLVVFVFLVSTCIWLFSYIYSFRLKLLQHKNPQQVKDPGKRSGSAAVLAPDPIPTSAQIAVHTVGVGC